VLRCWSRTKSVCLALTISCNYGGVPNVAERGYVLISHNASDFCRHHREFLTRGETHAGLIVVQQQTLSVGGRLRGVIKLAAARSPEAMRNHIEFLSAWA
jgi:hypothetical protein